MSAALSYLCILNYYQKKSYSHYIHIILSSAALSHILTCAGLYYHNLSHKPSSTLQGSTNRSILPSGMGERGGHREHEEHRKYGKHQSGDLRHSNYDSKHPIYDWDSNTLFIGPESDHWLCLSVTHSLTD